MRPRMLTVTIANIIVSVHFNCKHLEITNSTSIDQFFDRTMKFIWPQRIEYNNYLLLVHEVVP
jgi:hypothetical protein